MLHQKMLAILLIGLSSPIIGCGSGDEEHAGAVSSEPPVSLLVSTSSLTATSTTAATTTTMTVRKTVGFAVRNATPEPLQLTLVGLLDAPVNVKPCTACTPVPVVEKRINNPSGGIAFTTKEPDSKAVSEICNADVETVTMPIGKASMSVSAGTLNMSGIEFYVAEDDTKSLCVYRDTDGETRLTGTGFRVPSNTSTTLSSSTTTRAPSASRTAFVDCVKAKGLTVAENNAADLPIRAQTSSGPPVLNSIEGVPVRGSGGAAVAFVFGSDTKAQDAAKLVNSAADGNIVIVATAGFAEAARAALVECATPLRTG